MGLFDFFSTSTSSPSPSSSPSPPPSEANALERTASASTSTSSSTSTSALAPPASDLSSKHVTALNPRGIKPCCACPETKIPRDDCFLRYGHEGSQPGTESEGEGWRCRDLVEEHRKCMSRLGFKI